MRSSWNVTSPSRSRPSHESESWICCVASATSRLVSVFSIRRWNSPPSCCRANSQLKSAVRTLPMCSRPVGLGAMRTRTLMRLAYSREREGPDPARTEPDDAAAPAPAQARAALARASDRAARRIAGAAPVVALPRALGSGGGVRAGRARAGAATAYRRQGAPDARDAAPRLGAGPAVLRLGCARDAHVGACPGDGASAGRARRTRPRAHARAAANPQRADEGARDRPANARSVRDPKVLLGRRARPPGADAGVRLLRLPRIAAVRARRPRPPAGRRGRRVRRRALPRRVRARHPGRRLAVERRPHPRPRAGLRAPPRPNLPRRARPRAGRSPTSAAGAGPRNRAAPTAAALGRAAAGAQGPDPRPPRRIPQDGHPQERRRPADVPDRRRRRGTLAPRWRADRARAVRAAAAYREARARERGHAPRRLASLASTRAPRRPLLRRDQEGARQRARIRDGRGPALRPEPARLALPRARSGRPREVQATARRARDPGCHRPRALPAEPREPEGRLLREERHDPALDDGRRLRDRGGRGRLPRRLAPWVGIRGRTRAGGPGTPAVPRALLGDDLALHGERSGHRRHRRTLARRAGGHLRRGRTTRAARRLPRLVPSVCLGLRRQRPESARRTDCRARRAHRPRPPALPARERLEGAARLEPRPARQHRRRPPRREARRLSRPSETAGAPRAARGPWAGRPRARRGADGEAAGALQAGYEAIRAITRNEGSPTGSSWNSGLTQPSSSSRLS